VNARHGNEPAMTPAIRRTGKIEVPGYANF